MNTGQKVLAGFGLAILGFLGLKKLSQAQPPPPGGKYIVTIISSSGGTTDPPPGTYEYDAGATAVIAANPLTTYIFTGWSGDAQGVSNPLNIVVDSNKTIQANFSQSGRKPIVIDWD